MNTRAKLARIRAAAAVLGSTAVVAAILPAAAAAACPGGTESHPFAAFGDEASYVIAPGGTFETGAPGWTLSDARVVEGNETFADTGTHSLEIESGGAAVSPSVCVGGEYPTFRLFARQLTGPSDATLTASLRWVDLLGITVESSAGSVPASGAWEPSPVMRLGNTVPLWIGGTTLPVQLVFRSSGGGSWAIDDTYIDPYSR